MHSRARSHRPHRLILTVTATTLAAIVAVSGARAQPVHDSLVLSPDGPRSGTLRGRAGGNTSFPAAVAQRPRDDRGNACLGFGTLRPNHHAILEGDFRSLTFQVNSGRQDTTLVVKGPDGLLLCGDDTDANNPDARIRAALPAGTYEIWVGAFEAGQEFSYELTVE